MAIFALAFLLGIYATFFVDKFPNYRVLGICLGFVLLLGYVLRTHINKIHTLLIVIGMIILGFCWVLSYLTILTSWQLPKAYEKKDLIVQGVIYSVPEQYPDHVKFNLKTTSIDYKQYRDNKSVILQLNWYGFPPKIVSGQEWRLMVRLKRPHGFSNLGAYSTELHLLQNHILAQGYVRVNPINHLVSDKLWNSTVSRLRQHMLEKIRQTLANYEFLGFIEALTIGITQDITRLQWQLLRATGTSHLMAISGLHIGLVAGLAFSLVNLLWRRVPLLVLKIPAQQAAAFASLAAGGIYSLIAGFSIPTQRAFIMLCVFLVLLLSKRQTNAWQALSLALLIVLLINPLAILSMGFWLSFAAVMFIVYGIADRYRAGGLWWKYGRVQWVVTLGLTPLCLLLFQQASLSSLLANTVAIPWVSFTVVPVALLGALTINIFPWLGVILLKVAAASLFIIMKLLSYLANIKFFLYQKPINQPWVFVSAFIGTALLLAPRGFPGRVLGIIWLFPICFYKNPTLKNSEVWFTVLDVGQGLATVIRTANHVLVYDTGPKFSAEFDAGTAIVVPYLRYQGIQNIDALVVSHGDSDHSGGAKAILQELTVKKLYTSVPPMFGKSNPISCQGGQQWQWDGIHFAFLSPPKQSFLQGNNRSCVLRVTIGQQHILLTGDIEKPAEQYLLTKIPEQLSATVLVAPHHGSLTSSSEEFIKAIHPEYVIFSTGYLNRFGFPKTKVQERYLANGAKVLNTAECGMIIFKFSVNGSAIDYICYRENTKNILNFHF